MSNLPNLGPVLQRLPDILQALVLVAIPAGAAWALRTAHARRRRHAADVELREALCDASRVSLDCERWQLEGYLERQRPGHLVVSPEQRRSEAAVLLSRAEAARKRFWAALGCPDPSEHLTADQKAILTALSQTLRLRAREMEPDQRRAYLEQRCRDMRQSAGPPENRVPLFKDEAGDA